VSDLTHSRTSEGFLAEAKAVADPAVLPIEFALVHANLAIARAIRELDTTVRQGFEKVAQATNGSTRILLAAFRDDGGQAVLVNPREVQFIEPDDDQPESFTRLYMASGRDHLVAGEVVDVSATIFQMVG
jgi:hypothetical protein